MTKDEIKQEIYNIAEKNNYKVNEETVDKIINAKLRFFGEENWHKCPCVRDDEHACLSLACSEQIESTGKCHCNLFLKKQDDTEAYQKDTKVKKPKTAEDWVDEITSILNRDSRQIFIAEKDNPYLTWRVLSAVKDGVSNQCSIILKPIDPYKHYERKEILNFDTILDLKYVPELGKLILLVDKLI